MPFYRGSGTASAGKRRSKRTDPGEDLAGTGSSLRRRRIPEVANAEEKAPSESPAERLRIAFDLHAFAAAMVRQNWLRKHPGASEEEAEAALSAWLTNRPGAEHGDCEGRPIGWPRTG